MVSAESEVGCGYDWKGLGKALLVYVGGSRGHISICVAEVAPETSFVVQDFSEVISQVSGPPVDLEEHV